MWKSIFNFTVTISFILESVTRLELVLLHLHALYVIGLGSLSPGIWGVLPINYTDRFILYKFSSIHLLTSCIDILNVPSSLRKQCIFEPNSKLNFLILEICSSLV